MTLIEAMAARLPIVATDVGDVSKLIRDQETGLLVEPANPESLTVAISRLLSEPQFAATLAVAGQKLACEQFSADVMAAEYIKRYREAVGDAGWMRKPDAAGKTETRRAQL